MRLTPDLVKGAPAYINPIGGREISLRGFKIPAIENLGVTQDAYDTLDLSENEITRLTNLPILKRLETLLLANNKIAAIDSGLGSFVPALASLVLTNNRLSELSALEPLADLPSLTHLSLMGNPVARVADYRLFVISRCPNLKTLDFQKVKAKEREAAVSKFPPPERKEEKKAGEEAAARAAAAAAAAPKTFTPGEGLPSFMQQTAAAPVSRPKQLSQEERAKLLEQLKSASSVEEADRIGRLLQEGSGGPRGMDTSS